MKRKFYILGVLAALCLLGTGYYARTLYNAHLKQVAEWNEGAKTAFEEALWMEVNKRAEIPFYSASNEANGTRTLNEKILDSVYVTSVYGRKKYRLERYKYDNSLIKETVKRGDLGSLLETYPLSVDTISANWKHFLSVKSFPVKGRIRYIYTDLNLNNDTVYSKADKGMSQLDSLAVKYLGFRCEHELTAYISYPYWMSFVTFGQYVVLLLPWLLLLLLYILYPYLEAWFQRRLVREKVVIQEKTVEVEKEIVVEKKVHLADVKMDKARVFQLPDGTVFDTFACTLTRDGLQQRLQPQSVSLLMLFLKEDNHKVSSDTISEKLWGETGLSERIYSATRRLRNDLKKVNSGLVIECSYGIYELKSPISSHKSDQN